MAEQNTKKKYNLKNDVIFKTFFSRKGNEIFLIDFLEALLKIKIDKIEIKEEVNLEKLAVEEKGGRLDLQAKLNNGVIVNIELQMKNYQDIEERTTYYGAKIISRETERGEKYINLNKVIMINILGYNFLEFEEYISETEIVLKEHKDHEIIKGLKWYFIELPKFRKQNPNMDEKINQWLAFIDDYNKGAIEMAEKKNNTLKRARIEMDHLTGDEEVRRLAELREKWEMDYVSGMDYAEKKGKLNAKTEIAKKLIELGVEDNKIIEATGLTKEEIEKIKEE